MVSFRKLKIGDLGSIYQNEHLRSLVTLPPKGERFVIVIEENGIILGGAGGYVEQNVALLQHIAMMPVEDYSIYKDGMIRSLIHILELEGLEYLFLIDKDVIYENIGFKAYTQNDWLNRELGTLIKKDLYGKEASWIDLKDFFDCKD